MAPFPCSSVLAWQMHKTIISPLFCAQNPQMFVLYHKLKNRYIHKVTETWRNNHTITLGHELVQSILQASNATILPTLRSFSFGIRILAMILFLAVLFDNLNLNFNSFIEETLRETNELWSSNVNARFWLSRNEKFRSSVKALFHLSQKPSRKVVASWLLRWVKRGLRQIVVQKLILRWLPAVTVVQYSLRHNL
jgi:hypothetical protein